MGIVFIKGTYDNAQPNHTLGDLLFNDIVISDKYISLTEFEVHTVSNGPFIPVDLWPKRFA